MVTLHYIIVFGGSQFNCEVVVYDSYRVFLVDIMQKICRMMGVGSRFLSEKVHIFMKVNPSK